MRIQSGKSQPNLIPDKGMKKTGTNSVGFAQSLSQTSKVEKKQPIVSIEKDMLLQLAGLIKGENASREEVSRAFVGLVLKEKFGGLPAATGKKIEKEVGAFISQDEQFASRLERALKRL